MAIGKFLDGVYRLAAYLAGALLVFLTLLVLYSIVARLIGTFSGGASDMAGYVMATCTFMALPYTFRSQGHIRVSLLVNRLHASKRRFAEIFALGYMSLLTAYLAWYMTRLALDSYEFGERSQGADAILLWIPQTPVAIGASLFAVAVFHTFIEVLRNPELTIESGEEV